MSSSSSNQPTFLAPRDQDELEGTLLLPTATEITCAPGAVPTADLFEYATTPIAYNYYPADDIAIIPVAPSIPKYDNLSSRERTTQQQTAIGKRRGLQQAELEKEKTMTGQINASSNNYFADKKIEEANRLAKQRNIKGVEIETDTWFGHEQQQQQQQQQQDEKSTTATTTVSMGGSYKVAEYNMSEYVPDDNYEVSEYKSVYD